MLQPASEYPTFECYFNRFVHIHLQNFCHIQIITIICTGLGNLSPPESHKSPTNRHRNGIEWFGASFCSKISDKIINHNQLIQLFTSNICRARGCLWINGYVVIYIHRDKYVIWYATFYSYLNSPENCWPTRPKGGPCHSTAEWHREIVKQLLEICTVRVLRIYE